jgi:hypothetical protein
MASPGKFHPSQRQWPQGMPESIRETTYKEPAKGFCLNCPDHEACMQGAPCETVRSVLNLVDVYCPNTGCDWHVRVDEKVKDYNLEGHLMSCPRGTLETTPLLPRTFRAAQEDPGDEDRGTPKDSSTGKEETLRTAPVLLAICQGCFEPQEFCECKPSLNFEEEKIPRTFETVALRKFETGATRDGDSHKLDFEGFLSPLVLKRYAEFMHTHRFQSDGELRDSDNWQKGIPQAEYMKSGWRHFMAWWMAHRGHETDETLEEALCALIFNASGYLHEHLKSHDQPS